MIAIILGIIVQIMMLLLAKATYPANVQAVSIVFIP